MRLGRKEWKTKWLHV